MLTAAGRFHDSIAHGESWYARHPGSARAKLIRGCSLVVRAKLAWEAEEYQAAGQYHREQRDYLLAFVRESNETGKIQMQFWSSWAILVAAQSSAVLGDREQSSALFQAVVEYYDRQPPVVNLFPDLQLGIAHSGLGNKAAAIEYFDAAQRNGARFFLLDHMDVTTGRYDIWGMHRDIAFQENVARERRHAARPGPSPRQMGRPPTPWFTEPSSLKARMSRSAIRIWCTSSAPSAILAQRACCIIEASGVSVE